MTLMKDDSYYHVRDVELPADETPCVCSGCDWRGTFALLESIESCSLTPGDPSPAGRCPECESLAYVDAPKKAATAWVATVSHRHGMNFYAAASEDGARSQVASYCREEWETEVGDDPIPENDADVISVYFEKVSGEYMDVAECTVTP